MKHWNTYCRSIYAKIFTKFPPPPNIQWSLRLRRQLIIFIVHFFVHEASFYFVFIAHNSRDNHIFVFRFNEQKFDLLKVPNRKLISLLNPFPFRARKSTEIGVDWMFLSHPICLYSVFIHCVQNDYFQQNVAHGVSMLTFYWWFLGKLIRLIFVVFAIKFYCF